MRRIFAAAALTAVMLTGCTMPQGSAGKAGNHMTGSFTAEVTVTNADSETKGTLTRFGTDAWRVEFSDPPALSGVQLDFIDNEVTATYKGLEFSVPQSAQAVRTELSGLMTAVDSMAQTTELTGNAADGCIDCEGELDVGSYTLTVTTEGIPVRFSLPAYGLLITFDTFTEQSGMSPTETPTIPKTYPVEEEASAEAEAES